MFRAIKLFLCIVLLYFMVTTAFYIYMRPAQKYVAASVNYAIQNYGDANLVETHGLPSNFIKFAVKDSNITIISDVKTGELTVYENGVVIRKVQLDK